MKKPLTIYDILGTIEGLQEYGLSLREAAQTKVHNLGDFGVGVLVDPVALATISTWLFEAAKELQNLIPDGPIQMGSDQPEADQ